MALDEALLGLLACPQCRGKLALVDVDTALLCDRCKIKYPVHDGIPVMLVEEAIDIRSGTKMPSAAKPLKIPRVSFKVTSGPDLGLSFQLEHATCKAMGRASFDPNKTTVFNVDVALALDESTKSLILNYVAKQFKKSAAANSPQVDKLGQFRRTSDVILTDSTLSKLHAMIFADESGVSVLDLVSKNGTYVNGEEVESRILKKGDAIELGETTIIFEG